LIVDLIRRNVLIVRTNGGLVGRTKSAALLRLA